MDGEAGEALEGWAGCAGEVPVDADLLCGGEGRDVDEEAVAVVAELETGDGQDVFAGGVIRPEVWGSVVFGPLVVP
jgi:hypothetical protein